MPMYIGQSKLKLYIGSRKVKKAYQGEQLVYSAGNIVTYHVDVGVSYQEEVEDGESCLAPKTFTPVKSGWYFVGWRLDATANTNVLSSLTMGDNAITLYAVFNQNVTLRTYISGAVKDWTKTRIYNNGNIFNPTISIEQPLLSGANWIGWCNVSGTVIYTDINNLTLTQNLVLYAGFQYPDANVADFSNKSIDFRGSDNYTVYAIDNTKYSGHTVTAQVTDMRAANNTIGWTISYLYVDGTQVRIVSQMSGDHPQKEGAEIINGSTDLPGSYGKVFTLTSNGDLIVRVVDGSSWGVGQFKSATIFIKSLTLIGKRVIG